MAQAHYIEVKEEIDFLRKSHKQASLLLRPRLYMLILMKEAGASGISKQKLMKAVGVSSQSIQTW